MDVQLITSVRDLRRRDQNAKRSRHFPGVSDFSCRSINEWWHPVPLAWRFSVGLLIEGKIKIVSRKSDDCESLVSAKRISPKVANDNPRVNRFEDLIASTRILDQTQTPPEPLAFAEYPFDSIAAQYCSQQWWSGFLRCGSLQIAHLAFACRWFSQTSPHHGRHGGLGLPSPRRIPA
jgi:hypothetical protein